MNRQDDIYGERSAPGAGSTRTSPSSPQGGQGGTDPAVEGVTSEARQAVGQVAGQAQQQASSMASNQMNAVAERLAGLSDMFRTVSQQSRENDQTMVAEVADRAGQQVERVSNYLRERDLDDLIEETQEYARRQPAIFLGSTFVLGLLAARFFKSSSQRSRAKRGYQRTGRELAPSGAYGAYQGRTGGLGAGGTRTGPPMPTAAAPTAGTPPRTMREETPEIPRSTMGTTIGTSVETARTTEEPRTTARETPGSEPRA